MSAVPSTRLWKSCCGRYGLASEHSRAGYYMSLVALPTLSLDCLITSVVLRLQSVAWRMPCNGFCTDASPNTWVSCRIRGSEFRIVYLLVAVGWVGQRGEKRWREVVKTAFYPLLSCFLSFTSFTPLCCQKPERDQRRPTWKASLRFCFSLLCLAALSIIDMEMLNPKSSLHLGCRDRPHLTFSFVSLFPPLLSSPSSYPFFIISSALASL